MSKTEIQAKFEAYERAIRRLETELRVVREDVILLEEGVTADIKRLDAQIVALTEEPVEITVPPVLKPSALTRDDVITLAKADLTELALDDRWNEDRRELSGVRGPFYLYDGRYGVYAEFAVNSAKRTVTCSLRGFRFHSVLKSATARCAPNDCFNKHIGRAISLRRALGWEIPDYYTHAPQPTEPAVGDVVRGKSVRGPYSADKTFTLTSRYEKADDAFRYNGYASDWIHSHQIGAIVNDSRETAALGGVTI